MQNQSLCHEDPLEKDGNPLQCSCLEHPMDRAAWWATVHRFAESDTTATKQQQHSSSTLTQKHS